MDLLSDNANSLSTTLLFPFSDRVSLESKVESNSRFSCLCSRRIGTQGVFSVMQLGISSKSIFTSPLLAFFFLALKVPGWLHIPHEKMEVERAEIKLPLATSYRTARSGSWPTFNLLSYSPHLFHTVYESVLQVLNICMLWTLPEDLTTPRHLEPVPLWEEFLFLSLQINLLMWSHLKNEHLNTDTNLLLPANGGVGGMCSD